MREEELPVCGADAGSEYAQHLEGGAEDKDGAEIARIGEASREGTYEEKEKDLNRANPGDGRGWKIESRGVVGLE